MEKDESSIKADEEIIKSLSYKNRKKAEKNNV